MPSSTHAPLLIDSDVSPASLPKNRALALLNVTPERGYLGLAAGTVMLPASLAVPVGTNIVVGSHADPDGQSVVYFLCNSAGTHQLLRYRPATGQTSLLLAAPVLDLVETDEVTQMGIVGDYLAWLDREGRQWRLNMTVAEAGGYAGLADANNFRLALPVPLYPAGFTRRPAPAGAANLVNRVGAEDWQIAYRYGYADNDVTVLAVSDVNRATKPMLGEDALLVLLPADEVPSPLVERIEFYARKNEGISWRKIKVLKRDATGAFPIDPATGFTPRISFTFYGQLGDALDEPSGSKQFEAIPMRSRALGAARSRFFLGNNERGYAATSVMLTASVENTGLAFTNSQLPKYTVKLTYGVDTATASNYREGYASFLLIAGVHGQATARYINNSYNPFLSAAIAVPDAPRFTRAQLIDETKRLLELATPGTAISLRSTDQDGLAAGSVTYLSGPAVRRVKSNSSYQLGVEFFDYAGNTSGTLTSEAAQVVVGDFPWVDRSIEGSRFRWNLTTADANAEIPAWAVAYRLVITVSQTYRFFRQLYVAEILRLKVGADTAKPEFVEIDQPGGYLWLDISVLATGTSGYVWAPESNDRVRIWESPTSAVVHDYKIVGQQGPWLWVDEPVPVVYTRMSRIEIYSVRDGDATGQRYYEAGPAYPVVRTAGVRSYSATTGTLDGDVLVALALFPGISGIGQYQYGNWFAGENGLYYPAGNVGLVGSNVLTPAALNTAYYAIGSGERRLRRYGLYAATNAIEGQSPASTGIGGIGGFFEVLSDIPANAANWLNDRGRPSTVLSDGPPQPAILTNEVCWGGVLVPGSRINGLSSFAEGDAVRLPAENGAVQALVLGNQQQSTGTVLIGWQAHGGASLYLGEAVVSQSTGGTLQTDSSKVVGTVRPLAGTHGTVHPGSIDAWDGMMWAWDAEHAELLRYDQSGITRLATTYHGRALCRALAAAYSTARVSGGYDPEAQVYYLSFAPLGGTRGRTIGFSERADNKGFCGDYSFASPTYATLGDFLYSFDGAAVRRHDPAAPRNTFSDVLYPARVKWVANEGNEVSKEWLSLAYHGTDAWDTPELFSEQEGGRIQRSRTYAAWGKFQQGAYTVALRRDTATPTTQPDGTLLVDPARLLYAGRTLQSPWLEVNMEILSAKNVRLEGVSVNFLYLGGQQPVPRP